MKSKFLMLAGLVIPLSTGTVFGLTFDLTKGSGLIALEGSDPAKATDIENGFAAAAARWSVLFTDNMIVRLTIDSASLGAGIIGSTGTTSNTYNYTAVRSALINDKTSADDTTATSSLQTGPGVKLLLNRTANNPNGAGSATPYVDNNGDANNTKIRITNANAKALGLLSGNQSGADAAITFSSNFAFDFDPSNGINGSQIDFVGVATHEIGHALGFISGVDILDTNSTSPNFYADNQFTYVSTLDLYRYSSTSVANGAIDWTADTRSKFFSIDGGTTSLATFSTGVTWGDGRQDSHWKDNLGIGIMDPTAGWGELMSISARDIQAFDVIGYNVNVPEPAMAVLLLLTGTIFLRSRRRW